MIENVLHHCQTEETKESDNGSVVVKEQKTKTDVSDTVHELQQTSTEGKNINSSL
jgi:hypothetical protein